ncbi:hypothetical protein [Burkholderia seminalis]|uniref:Lipid A biosynthesis lauroyl acyltransferase n=1 Tax=Burkholderia cenocepacia TaxID=95486 RepID=A0A071MWZ6_9BURK|nr:hypothetical protein [Burkholderia seminalis]MCA8302997.1 hypothetical protein [Burkholderia seminalis]MCA8425504.1 hypothetical protein [Burkholderia seminalis]MDN7851940.1 hypothetical protein [Burkholderia seminalis]
MADKRQRRLGWRDRWLLRLSGRGLERLALAVWVLRSLGSPRTRWAGRLRYEWGRDHVALTRAHIWRTMAAGEFERLMDRRLHAERAAGRDVEWPGLEAATQALARAIARIRDESGGRPVIVSPFHYVSQFANVIVIDALRDALQLSEIAVVSGIARETYGGFESTLMPNVRVLHTYDEVNRNALGLRVLHALRRNGVAVVFADAPPYLMQRFPMETIEVAMFGRPARIHRGVFRIGARAGAVLVPFHLEFAAGRFDHRIFPPIDLEQADAPQRVADCIERACIDAYPDWILAGHPSQYGFAPLR